MTSPRTSGLPGPPGAPHRLSVCLSEQLLLKTNPMRAEQIYLYKHGLLSASVAMATRTWGGVKSRGILEVATSSTTTEPRGPPWPRERQKTHRTNALLVSSVIDSHGSEGTRVCAD